MQVRPLSPAPLKFERLYMRTFRIFTSVVLSLLLVATVGMAKDKKKEPKPPKPPKLTNTKIESAADTLKIEFAKDIPDPDKPKKAHVPGNFAVDLYDSRSLAWNTFDNVLKVNTGLSGTTLRLVVDEPGVTVTLEELKYWPGVEWYQPLNTVLEFETVGKRAYEMVVPLAKERAQYRLLVRNGEQLKRIYLTHNMFSKHHELGYESEDNVVYWIENHEPMSYLLRVYAYWTARKGSDVRYIRPLYWRTIATSWSMVMGNTAPLDKDGYYHSTEWFFDEFAYALFPGVDWPDLRVEDHVIWFAERPEPYVIRRRTFDINYVTIMCQRREDDYLIVTLCVKGDHHDDKIDIYMTPASRYQHPFAWKIEKGVIL